MNDKADFFKRGMRRLAAGVSLITTRDGMGVRHGMVATSVTSVSLTPPSLLTCINRSASSHDALAEAGVFCVNLLPEGADDIAMRFSSARFRDVRFVDGNWSEMETGSPVLDDAIASFDCRVTSAIEASSHTIFIGEVVAVRMPEQPMSPLLYLNGAFARCAPATQMVVEQLCNLASPSQIRAGCLDPAQAQAGGTALPSRAVSTGPKNEEHLILRAHLISKFPHASPFYARGRAWPAAQQLPDEERLTISRELDWRAADVALLDREIAQDAIEDSAVNRLMTITGANVAVAAGIVARIGDISWFRSPAEAAERFLAESTIDSRTQAGRRDPPRLVSLARGAARPLWLKPQPSRR